MATLGALLRARLAALADPARPRPRRPVTFAAVLGRLFWVWSLRSSPRGAQFWLAAAGTAAMLSAAVVTRVVNPNQ